MPRKSNENQPAPVATGPQRKPKPDLYTVFLVIALVAVLMGILFLFLEMQLYEFKIKGAPPVGMVNPWSAMANGEWRMVQNIPSILHSPFSIFPIPNP